MRDDPPKPTETKTDAKPAGDTTTTPTKGESSELGIDVKMQIGGVETSAHFKSNDDFIKLLSEEGAHGINVTVESVTNTGNRDDVGADAKNHDAPSATAVAAPPTSLVARCDAPALRAGFASSRSESWCRSCITPEERTVRRSR